jgi:hypothetical protein
MRKLTLGVEDLKFLEWVKHPPVGDDRKAIARHMEGGRFDSLVNYVNHLLPDDDERMHQSATCLQCGRQLDAASPVGHSKKPMPGGITVCAGCGYVQAYGRDMQFRELTGAERIAMQREPRILAIQEARAIYLDRIKPS